jgi:hypothetical protein
MEIEMSLNQSSGTHNVMAAYIGPLFCKPDSYEVLIDVCKWGSRWRVRMQGNGFTNYGCQMHRSKTSAIAEADNEAALIAGKNERARAAKSA